MKVSEMKKLLKAIGCFKVKEGGNHEIWFSPKTGKKFPIGRHDSQELKNGTQESIMKAAGLK